MRRLRKPLSWLLTLCMLLSLVTVPVSAAPNDTEFHIMDWQQLKEFVREANQVDEDEKITIHSIYVNGTSGTATGGVTSLTNYTNQGDKGAPGTNGVLDRYEHVWSVLNTVEIIPQDSVKSLTVHAKIGTGDLGYGGTKLDPVTIY